MKKKLLGRDSSGHTKPMYKPQPSPNVNECYICGDIQDHRHFEDKAFCNTCADHFHKQLAFYRDALHTTRLNKRYGPTIPHNNEKLVV